MEHNQTQTIHLTPAGFSLPSCIACGGAHFRSAPSVVAEFLLFHCRQCGTAFTFPQKSEEELEKYYRQSYYGPENVKFYAPLEWIVAWISHTRAQWISRLIPDRSRILEIGCGRGLLLQALHMRGHHCFGIERSELAATRAMEFSGLQIFTRPAGACGFADESFDLAILWHVFEHLHSPAQTLAELFRLLKPGGKVLIEVPNLASLQSRLTGKHWFHQDVERHLYHFTPAGLCQLLTDKGFSVTRKETFSFEQGPFGALQSLLNLLGFPPELLYLILKRESSMPRAWKAFLILVAGLLFPLSIIVSLLESLIGRGAVIRIIGEKPPGVFAR